MQRIQIDLNSPIQLMHRKQQMTFTNVILQRGAQRLGTASLCLAPFVLLTHITLHVHAVSSITSNATSLLEMCNKVQRAVTGSSEIFMIKNIKNQKYDNVK